MHILFLDFSDAIRNIPGKRFIPRGYIKDRPKLINVFFKK